MHARARTQDDDVVSADDDSDDGTDTSDEDWDSEVDFAWVLTHAHARAP